MKTKGFTLIECLLALFFLSLSLLIVPSIIQQSKEINQLVMGKTPQMWQVFLIQLENKLAEGEFVAVRDNRLHFQKFFPDTNQPYDCRIEFNSTRNEVVLRENGGYEPFLTGVKELQFIQVEQNILFEVTFDDGEVKHGKWTVPPT